MRRVGRGPGLSTGDRRAGMGRECDPGGLRPSVLILLHPPQHHREEWSPFRGARCLPFHSSSPSPVSGQGWAEGGEKTPRLGWLMGLALPRELF